MSKYSLFIQAKWYPPNDLIKHLEHVRLFHKDRSSNNYIHNVVLDEIGDHRGLSSNMLLIRPYLPGGRLKTFDNVFVGSSVVKWVGKGSAYSNGMTNPAHRWANLYMQRRLWKLFEAQQPSHMPYHHYINHEGVLNHFDVPRVRAGYEAYLIQSMRDSHKIKPKRAILWSPAIWSGRPLTRAEEGGIARTFEMVQHHSDLVGHHRGIGWLHFQDMMGRGRLDVNRRDVEQWYKELSEAYDWASLRINMEMFGQTPAAVQASENWYQSRGLRVGASWSLRHWYKTHAH